MCSVESKTDRSDFMVVFFVFMGTIWAGLMGCCCIVWGYQMCFKEKITLLNRSHYDKVSEKNKKAFCRLSGLGLISIGLGLLISVIICVTVSLWGLIALAIGLVAGVVLLVYAVRKYNH